MHGPKASVGAEPAAALQGQLVCSQHLNLQQWAGPTTTTGLLAPTQPSSSGLNASIGRFESAIMSTSDDTL